MSSLQVSQGDWDALAARYGAVSALLLVHERRLADLESENAALRQQLAQCVDEVHKAAESEGGT